MEDAGDLNRIRLDLIDNDVRQRCKCKLTPACHAAAGSPKIGKVFQTGTLVINRSGNTACSFGIVALEPFADLL
jgi:hypothetical protein